MNDNGVENRQTVRDRIVFIFNSIPHTQCELFDTCVMVIFVLVMFT